MRRKRAGGDLFGQIPCTFAEVALWCVAVAGICPDSPRFAHYARGWQTVAKVRTAKAAGSFESTIETSLQRRALSLPEAWALLPLFGETAPPLHFVNALVREVNIAAQIAQLNAQPAPGGQPADNAGDGRNQQGLHDLPCPPAFHHDRPRPAKGKAETVAKRVILDRREKLRALRERRKARMGGGFSESGQKKGQREHGQSPLVENGFNEGGSGAGKTCVPAPPLGNGALALGQVGFGHAHDLTEAGDSAIKNAPGKIHSTRAQRLSRRGEPSPAHHESNCA